MTENVKIGFYSQSYGYNNDLMYFYPIFKGVCAYRKNVVIAVPSDFPVAKYSDLPLWPVLEFFSINRRSKVGLADYVTTTGIPKIKTILSLLFNVPDISIVIEFTPISLIAILSAKIRRKKVLLLVENHPRFRGGVVNKISDYIKSLFARSADGLMTSNSFGFEYLVRNLKVNGDNVVVLPYLTSEPGYFYEAGDFPRGFEVPHKVEGRINVLYLNSINKRKGLSNFVDSVALLSNEVKSSFIFHIAGDGDMLETIKNKVAVLGLSHLFVFYGKVDFKNIYPYYEISDIFVSPTLADYRSLAGFEAVSSGKPVLISKYDGACTEVVEHDVNGWIFDPECLSELSGYLEKIFDDRDILLGFSSESQRKSKDFSYDKIVSNINLAIDFSIRPKC